MDELTNKESLSKKGQEETVDRRELLKALAATGGAVTAATLLPGKWTKPVIEVGLLPAHAQTSPLDLTAFGTPGPGIRTNGVSSSDFLITDIRAEVTPPTPNVDIVYVLQTPSGDPINCPSGPSTQTRTTDASGVANFDDFNALDCAFETIFGQGVVVPSTFQFQLVFSFVDQATYGPATDTLGPYEIPIPL